MATTKSFVPDTFDAPNTIVSDHFYIRPLTPDIAVLDYEAIMSSIEALQGIFGPTSAWPNTNITLEENIASLKVHEEEFNNRDAFAYSILTPDKSKCLGSVYIDPTRAEHYDCEVCFWLRDDSVELERHLFSFISNWLEHDWPFTKPAFPGRLISWSSWKNKINKA